MKTNLRPWIIALLAFPVAVLAADDTGGSAATP